MLKRVLKQCAYSVAPRQAAQLQEWFWLFREARLLRKKVAGLGTLEKITEELFGSPVFSPRQKRGEILSLLRQLQELRVKYICEIGAWKGGTLFMLCQVAEPDAKFLSIDINYPAVQAWAYPQFARERQRITCLVAD